MAFFVEYVAGAFVIGTGANSATVGHSVAEIVGVGAGLEVVRQSELAGGTDVPT